MLLHPALPRAHPHAGRRSRCLDRRIIPERVRVPRELAVTPRGDARTTSRRYTYDRKQTGVSLMGIESSDGSPYTTVLRRQPDPTPARGELVWHEHGGIT